MFRGAVGHNVLGVEKTGVAFEECGAAQKGELLLFSVQGAADYEAVRWHGSTLH
jgi:hypothetical protein